MRRVLLPIDAALYSGQEHQQTPVTTSNLLVNPKQCRNSLRCKLLNLYIVTIMNLVCDVERSLAIYPFCTLNTCLVLQDTFLDAAHLKESFPGSQVELQQGAQQAEPQRPFKVTFAQPPAQPQAEGKVLSLAHTLTLGIQMTS